MPISGLLVTGYQCSPETAWQEFTVSKQIYTATGRRRAPDKDVIFYLIIQSFEPGTITPEDANKPGYKLALMNAWSNSFFYRKNLAENPFNMAFSSRFPIKNNFPITTETERLRAYFQRSYQLSMILRL